MVLTQLEEMVEMEQLLQSLVLQLQEQVVVVVQFTNQELLVLEVQEEEVQVQMVKV